MPSISCTKLPPKRVPTSNERCSSRITVSPSRALSLSGGATSSAPKSCDTVTVTGPPVSSPAPKPHPATSARHAMTASRLIGR